MGRWWKRRGLPFLNRRRGRGSRLQPGAEAPG